MSKTSIIDLPEDTENDATPRPQLQLSATQVIASALAAITATVAASYLGIAGTVIGAAVASVLTVVGNAVYSHSIRRTSDRVITTVRTAVPATARFASRPGPAPWRVRGPARIHRTRSVVAASCVGLFAGVLLVVTAVELVAGRPLSDVVRGKQGSGTSLLGGDSGRSPRVTPSRQPTVTVTPTVVTSTPTVTVTGTPVTTTASPTSTTAPTAAPTPTTPPSASQDAGTSPGSGANTSPGG